MHDAQVCRKFVTSGISRVRAAGLSALYQAFVLDLPALGFRRYVKQHGTAAFQPLPPTDFRAAPLNGTQSAFRAFAWFRVKHACLRARLDLAPQG